MKKDTEENVEWVEINRYRNACIWIKMCDEILNLRYLRTQIGNSKLEDK